MKNIVTGVIILSIVLIFFGFYEFNSGGVFLNWKIILATLLIVALLVVRIFFTKDHTSNITKKNI